MPVELVVDFCEKLIAPRKRFVWFEQSTHLPNFEEPDRFCATVVRWGGPLGRASPEHPVGGVSIQAQVREALDATH